MNDTEMLNWMERRKAEVVYAGLFNDILVLSWIDDGEIKHVLGRDGQTLRDLINYTNGHTTK